MLPIGPVGGEGIWAVRTEEDLNRRKENDRVEQQIKGLKMKGMLTYKAMTRQLQLLGSL